MARRYELATRWNDETDERDWGLSIRQYSRIRDAIFTVACEVCALTGHRLEEVVLPVVANWAWDKDRRIILVPITEDDAFLVDPKWVTTVKREDREVEDHDE